MSQTLAPSPSAETALLIALTNTEMLGQLGGWGLGAGGWGPRPVLGAPIRLHDGRWAVSLSPPQGFQAVILGGPRGTHQGMASSLG